MPYGYTVTVWATGALLIHLHGTPNVAEAFAFVGGALTAFALLSWLASRRRGRPRADPPRSPLAAGLHLAAAGLALGAAALLDLLPDGLAWPLSSFAATLVYMAVAGAELALSAVLAGEEPAPGDGQEG